jgi:pyruvate carboxylase
VKTTLDFGKFVLKHPAFQSGNFDTNFVKEHFSTPDLLNDAMKEEEEALMHGIDEIWNHLKTRNAEEFSSREVSSSWNIARN